MAHRRLRIEPGKAPKVQVHRTQPRIRSRRLIFPSAASRKAFGPRGRSNFNKAGFLGYRSDASAFRSRQNARAIAQGYRVSHSTSNYSAFYPGKALLVGSTMRVARTGIVKQGKFYPRDPVIKVSRGISAPDLFRASAKTMRRRNVARISKTTTISRSIKGKGFQTVPKLRTERRLYFKPHVGRRGFRTTSPQRYMSAQQMSEIRRVAASKRRRVKGRFA